MTDFTKALTVQIYPVGKKEGQKPKKDAFVHCYIDASTLTPMTKKLNLNKYNKTHPFDLPFTNLACLARYVASYLNNNPTLEEAKVKKIKKVFGEIIEAEKHSQNVDLVLANMTPLSAYWNPEGLTHEVAAKLEDEEKMFAHVKVEYVAAGPSHVYKPPVDTKKIGLVPDSLSLMPASNGMEPTDVGYDRAGYIKSLREIVGDNFISIKIDNNNQLFYQAPKSVTGIDQLIQVNKRATNALTPDGGKLSYKIYGNTCVVPVKPKPLKVTPPKANARKVAKAEKDAQAKKQAVKKNRDSVKSVPKTTKEPKKRVSSKKSKKSSSSMETTKTDTIIADALPLPTSNGIESGAM